MFDPFLGQTDPLTPATKITDISAPLGVGESYTIFGDTARNRVVLGVYADNIGGGNGSPIDYFTTPVSGNASITHMPATVSHTLGLASFWKPFANYVDPTSNNYWIGRINGHAT